ncbi:MAG: ribonuclease D [Desulfuromonas sp.]|uniref:ribonuclease D n=1 Tax=Desulfuromonas sp. TaxID=892 RepID=UPI000CC6AB7D|nr:ribonuclease D [Desulfuromonas sp.]PLX84392.1 MAG: ribonuclease D [Desulfuromonas sp.]
MPDTPVLTDPADLNRFVEELKREPVIAVDLEADSMHNYREKVCLLQFSTPSRTVLVDPLAVEDLSSLVPLLADPGVRKIFHAADYDVRCLNRDFGIEIRGLFDTMIASQFIGEEKVGLADVLNKYFGVELDKKFQRADWSIRPLPEGMIRYAAEDTRHLHRLVELLEDKLKEKGRLAWVSEEFSLLEQGRFAGQEGPMCLRIKGAGRLDRRQLGVLEELLRWRDGEAERRDCPPFKVVGNKALLEVARVQPPTLRGLVGLEGLFPRVVDRYGRRLLEAVEKGRNLPEGDLPVFPRTPRAERDPAAEKRLLLLKAWRRKKAQEMEMDPGIVINNALLEEVSRCPPRGAEDLADLPALKNWQREVLGEGILAALGSG